MQDPVLAFLQPRDLELGPKPAASQPLVHWRITRDADNVAWAVLDRKGASANTLCEEVIDELGRLLEQIEADPPKGLVIRSAKPAGFIAGADVSQFVGATDASEVEQRITAAHKVVDRLEALTLPTIAAVNGYCLGGGLEIALACHTRIAVEGSSFGFPEVQLGLHPGLGGTARFT
ncbi:MAG: enoyl-CoA hydratase-related protein, partial [Phenylobacterium sp.]